jgi:Sulfotransferase family
MQNHGYNAVERALHHLALGSRPIAEISFDVNVLLSSRMAGAAGKTESDGRHVFVSGLARAGTTIIMRRLHETGLFRSLTYRDMPFVLCPNLWERISNLSRRDMEAVERVHGDGLQVDVDSPEALDEVFWRVFAGSDYIKETHLCAHGADNDLVEKFRRYISCILHCQSDGSQKRRYLSKNNNNILRLGALRAAFPNSVILIPFRDPVQQANSLLNQHRKFSQLQGDDVFVRSYMKWLAHHEFGLEHRPFWFDNGRAFEASRYRASDINYWLEAWLRVYGWVRDNRPENGLFVCYEDICSDPDLWNRILEWLAVPGSSDSAEGSFSRAEDKAVSGVDHDLAAAARALYSDLRQEFARSRAATIPLMRRTVATYTI